MSRAPLWREEAGPLALRGQSFCLEKGPRGATGASSSGMSHTSKDVWAPGPPPPAPEATGRPDSCKTRSESNLLCGVYSGARPVGDLAPAGFSVRSDKAKAGMESWDDLR